MPIRADYVEDLALQQLETALRLAEIWKRRISKRHAHGIYGVLFYELEAKKPVYPTRRDDEAVNPDGSLARWGPMPAPMRSTDEPARGSPSCASARAAG